jgi:hypothetical protein
MPDIRIPNDVLQAAAERANQEQRSVTDVTATLMRDYAEGRTWLNLPDPCQDQSEVCWAPYREFGIPDPAEQSYEPPAGPVIICEHGYQRGNGAERIVIYWSRDGRRSTDPEVIQGDGLDFDVRRAAMGPWSEPPGTGQGSADGPLYSREMLDAAAAEIARQMHGGPADPDDLKFASEILTEAFIAGRDARASAG